MADDRSRQPVVGEWVDGLDVPVLDERAVRAGAGLLFLGGFSAWMTALTSGDVRPVRTFAVVFLVDMYLRLFAGTRFAPSLVVGAWIVRRQRPEWVAAQPKTVAWAGGVVFALAACESLGLLGLPEMAALKRVPSSVTRIPESACFFIDRSVSPCAGPFQSLTSSNQKSDQSPVGSSANTTRHGAPTRSSEYISSSGTPRR